MASDHKRTADRQGGLDLMIQRIRAAERRALVRRGIELWTRAEAQRAIPRARPPAPARIN